MSHWCETCGQEVPEGEAHNDAVWLGTPTEPNTTPVQSGRRSGGREKTLLLALGGLLALWALFVGVGQLVTPDEGIDESAAAELAEIEAERLAEAEAEEEAATAEEEAARQAETEQIDDGALTEVSEQSDDATVDGETDSESTIAPVSDTGVARTSPQFERLQRELEQRGSNPVIAYLAAGDVVVVLDLVTGETRLTQPVSSSGVPPEQFARQFAAGKPVFRAGPNSFAVDPSDLTVVALADDASIIVTDAVDGHTYWVDAQSITRQAAMVEVRDGEASVMHRSPGGFELVAADGLGLLGLPKTPTDGTMIATETEFVELSEHRVLTANAAARLEQVCDDSGCLLTVVENDADGAWTVSPNFVRLGDRFALAPDGKSLVRFSPAGFAELFLSEGPVTTWVDGNGVEAPAWSYDSHFVTWLDRIDEPELKFVFPSDRDRFAIDISSWGVPPPVSPELVVFERQGQDDPINSGS